MSTSQRSPGRRTGRPVAVLALATSAVAVAVLAFGIGVRSASAAGGRDAAARDAGDRPSARVLARYARPTAVPHPDGNAYSLERHALGEMLFYDPRLSGAGDISCASCHDPSKGWGDGRATAVGTRGTKLGRRTPTVLNTAWAAALFWDGRAETLEEQALGPIQAEGEMNMPLDSLVARVRTIPGYAPLFLRAYGTEPTAEAVAKAIAVFERTVVSGEAPFDRWLGGDERAMSAAAKRGFALFDGKANCSKCHGGWRFTDDGFHDVGVAGSDSGRAKVVPLPSVHFAFKTPTLRNVVERAPYMHDGSEATLEEVVELYDVGGRVRRPSVSPMIVPLGLSAAEKRDLVAFLRALSSPDKVPAPPALP